MTNNDIIQEKWYLYGRWKQPLLSGTFWPYFRESEFAQELSKLLGVQAPRDIFMDGYHMTHEGDNTTVKEYLVSLYEKGELHALYERLEQASVAAERRHLALLGNTSASDLDYLRELFYSYRDIIGSWSFLFRFAIPLEERVVEDGSVTSDAELLAYLKPYTRTTWLEQQTIEIKQFATAIKEQQPDLSPSDLSVEKLSPELVSRIEAHAQEFAWFGTHHWEGEGYSVEKCLADIKDQMNKGDEPTTTSLPEVTRSDDEIIWKLLATFAYWRTHCAEMSAKVIFASRPRLERVAKGWNLTYAELLNLSHVEILAALEKDPNSIELPKDFKERQTAYGVYLDEGKEYLVTGTELAEIIDAVVPKVDTSATEAKGVVASKGGVVKGTARVMLAPSDFPRFTEGDILIANETTPDFVPLMKKAAAIVTDTGGITSHAAIVSRELKKPCVIGTKIGTKIFLEGETIEVDTDTGVVRKV